MCDLQDSRAVGVPAASVTHARQAGARVGAARLRAERLRPTDVVVRNHPVDLVRVVLDQLHVLSRQQRHGHHRHVGPARQLVQHKVQVRLGVH